MSAHEPLSEADLTDEQREALARLRAKRRERTAEEQVRHLVDRPSGPVAVVTPGQPERRFVPPGADPDGPVEYVFCCPLPAPAALV